MTAITLPAYTPVQFDGPLTIMLAAQDLTKVVESVPDGDFADAFELLPSDKQDQILQSILTDKSIEWMLTEAVRRVTVDKVPTEAATLRALVQCVQAVAEIAEDEECAAAIAEIRRVVGFDLVRADLSRVEAERDSLDRLVAGVPDLVRSAFEEAFVGNGSGPLGPAWDRSKAKAALEGAANPIPASWRSEREKIASLESRLARVEAERDGLRDAMAAVRLTVRQFVNPEEGAPFFGDRPRNLRSIIESTTEGEKP